MVLLIKSRFSQGGGENSARGGGAPPGPRLATALLTANSQVSQKNLIDICELRKEVDYVILKQNVAEAQLDDLNYTVGERTQKFTVCR